MVKNIINSAMDEYSQKVYGPNGVAFNSPNKLQYDIDANAAAARVPSQIAEQTFPGMTGQVMGTLSDLAMPALALGSSPFYDMYQAGDRARAQYGIFNDSDPNVLGVTGDSEIPMGPSFPEYAKAVADENIPSSMMGRTLGAGQNLADRFGRITDGIGNIFFSPAGAAEINPNNTFTSSVAESPYEMDYMPPNRYTDFEPRVGQDKFNIMNPAAEEKLSLFQRGKDLASSGIGKAGKLGIDAFNMLKNNNPIGFLTSGLASLGDMFEYKGGDVTVDENGNIISAADLNKMNARGGYYTDAARNARNRTKSLAAFRARGATDSKRYNDLLLQEIKQEKARAEAKAAAQLRAANTGYTSRGTAIDFGDYYNSDGSANTSSSMANNPSQSYGGPRAKGGFIGYKNGGLVKMFKGKL